MCWTSDEGMGILWVCGGLSHPQEMPMNRFAQTLVSSFRSVAVLCAVVAMGALAGCGAAQKTDTADAKPCCGPGAGKAAAGEVTCPVSGKHFTPTADSPRATHEGKDYVFCCAGCASKFAAEPAKYAAAAAADAPCSGADCKDCAGKGCEAKDGKDCGTCCPKCKDGCKDCPKCKEAGCANCEDCKKGDCPGCGA
jgi:YHS domain-containing protein